MGERGTPFWGGRGCGSSEAGLEFGLVFVATVEGDDSESDQSNGMSMCLCKNVVCGQMTGWVGLRPSNDRVRVLLFQ